MKNKGRLITAEWKHSERRSVQTGVQQNRPVVHYQGLISAAAVLMIAAVVGIFIEHVMLVVVVTAVTVGGAAAGGCSNLITSFGTGRDPAETSCTLSS